MDKKVKKYILGCILGISLFIGFVVPGYWAKAASQRRSRNARIISDMSQLRTVAEIIYSEEGSYTNLGIENKDVRWLKDDILEQGSTLTIKKAADGSVYCAYTYLLDFSASVWYCVDGPEMTAIMTAFDPNSEGNCDGTTFVCPRESGEIPLTKKENEKKTSILVSLIVGGGLGITIVALALKKRLKRKDQIIENFSLIKKELRDNILFYLCTAVLVIFVGTFSFLYFFQCFGDIRDILGPVLLLGGFFIIPCLILIMLYRLGFIRKSRRKGIIVCWEAYAAPFLLAPFYFFLVFLGGEDSGGVIVGTELLVLILGASLSLASIIHRGKLNKVIGIVLLLTFLSPLASLLIKGAFSIYFK